MVKFWLAVVAVLVFWQSGTVVPVRADEPKNALVNGDLSADPDPAWKFIPNAAKDVPHGVDKDPQIGRYLYIRTTQSSPTTWWVQELSALPNTRYSLTLKARGFTSDEATDRVVSVGVYFQEGDRKWIDYKLLNRVADHQAKWIGSAIPDTKSWQTFHSEFTTPAKTAFIGIRLDCAGGPAEADFAQLQLVASPSATALLDALPPSLPRFNASMNPASANDVALTPDWSLADASRSASATRQRICLNALWAVQPSDVSGTIGDAGALGWAFVKVPGRVRSADKGERSFFYGQDRTRWAGENAVVPGFWLWRNVTLPPTSGKYRVEVAELAGGVAKAYWNGQSIGIVNDAWGASLNLPPSAKAGDDGQLALFVLANSTFDTATAHLIAGGKADRAYGYEANKRPWITELGDVYLVCEPAKPAMGDVRVSTSYRQKTLTVSVVDTTLPPGATWRVVARPVGGRGAAFQATPTAVSTGTGVTLTSTWQASHLWTPDDPFLYDLTVTLVDQHGHVVDESLPTRFGFREVWVDGKILRLNGQPLRLRPRMSGSIFRSDLAGVRRAFAFLKAMGFNCIIRPPSMQSEEDETPFYDEYYDVADETGMLMVPYTPYGQVTGGQFGSAQTSVDDDLARYMNARVIARTANHASVIAYSGFGPGLSIKGNPYNANPDWYGIAPLNAADKANALAAKFLLSDGAISPTRDAAPAFVRIVKALAPDRPFLSHYDTGQADGWGTFDYFNWTPTDEWARWIAPWAANGVKPIGAWEHGLPYPNSFTSHGIPDGDAEPWATEYAAARLGPAAYAMESDAYAKSIEEAYRRGKPTYQLSDTLRELIALPSVQAVWAEQNARIYRAWRTYGVPMGIEPFGPADNYVKPDLLRQGNGTVVADPKQPLKTPGFKADAWCRDGNWLGEDAPALVPFDPKSLLPLGAALRRNNGPLLAYISGAASDIAAVDHVYRSGESVSKQVALVWDGFTMRALTVSVTAKCGARVAFAKTWTVRLAPGEIRMLPFSFTAPSIDGARADAEISLSVADAGASVASDRFSFAVYGPDPKVPAMQIVALDPDGSAATMLARLGVSAIKISRADDLRGKRFDCLVVGRRALVKLRDSDISALLPAGASVLVLEQTDRDLEALGFRAFPTRTRVVFPLPQSNPVLSGVATADLAEWRVRPSLYPATTGPLRDGYNWRGDAYGTVASAVIETPTRGDFTPLLHCEFDLAMTPVVQTHIGGHRWLFCQLSLPDGVGTDPVATRVAGNLLRWIRSREAAPPQLPVTVSGDGGDEVAKALGLEPSHANDPRGVAVVTSTPHDIPAFRAWVAGGGVAIVLPLANVTDYAVLGCKAVVTSPTTRLMPMPSDTGNPLWLGLGAGDFHLRAPSSVLCFDGSVLREQAEGRGKWIFVGFDPRRLDLAAEPYLRLTYRRQCRVLSQLIANCGGQFPAIDQALLSRLRAPAYTLDIGFWKEARIREQPAGGSTDWTALRFNDLNWARFDLAGKSTAFGHVQARFGFYASFAAPSRNLVLDAGTMDDFDRCWLNGVLIGSVNPANHDPETAWSQRRLYPIPDGLVKPGAHNVLAIEAWNRNADTKGWKAQIRGPLELRTATEPMSLYAGYYRHADDPYLQHHW